MNNDISPLVERLRRDAIGAQYEGDEVTHDEAITALVALETERVRLSEALSRVRQHCALTHTQSERTAGWTIGRCLEIIDNALEPRVALNPDATPHFAKGRE